MRMRWLASEAKRLWLATALAGLIAIPCGMLAVQYITMPAEAEPWMVFLTFWSLFLLVHALLSWATFQRLDHDELRTALLTGTREKGLIGRLLRIPGAGTLLGVSNAPAFGRQLALIALLGVGAMFLDPAMRAMPVFRLLAVVVTAVSWINLLITYSIHYARLHATTDAGLAWPGRRDRTLTDYLYLATAVQTTFGTTDVTVTTTPMRRAISGHGLLSFLFNTVILVLALSLLLST